jgi:hypothetical protein
MEKLGTNANAIVYCPEFLNLSKRVPSGSRILAYYPSPSDLLSYEVVYSDGKMRRVRRASLESQFSQLQKLLQEHLDQSGQHAHTNRDLPEHLVFPESK